MSNTTTAPAKTGSSRKARQVVLIMSDTQRADMLNCYAKTGLLTPNLDRLAGQGIRFEKAYTCSPVCAPARSAIFTGIWPHANGVWGNELPLGSTVKTIGQRLSSKGVHCAYIGKWHLDGHDYFGSGMCSEGWDEKYWYDIRRYLDDFAPEERKRLRNQQGCNAGVQREETFANRCSTRAIDFLSKHHKESFFMVVSYDEPHDPYLSPRPYSDSCNEFEFPKSPNLWDCLEDKPEHQRVWAGDRLHANKDTLAIKYPKYFACNAFLDDEIGRVLNAVDKYAPDAMVIYTSDHGDMLLSHSLNSKGPAAYEEVMRIPFIVRMPGVIGENRVYRLPVSHIDIAPTIMDVMGFDVPVTLDGKSMRPIFENPEVEIGSSVFMEFGRFGNTNDGHGAFQPLRAVFDGRYKLCVNLLTSDEFYDLKDDPGEMRNLIDSPEQTVVRNRLHDELLEWMNRTRDPFRGYYWECRPWRKDARAKTWGYTGKRRYKAMDEGEPAQRDYKTCLDINHGRNHYSCLD